MSESKKSEKELVWERLQKPYLTTEQKLDIIREYNRERNDQEFETAIKQLKKLIEAKKNGIPKAKK